MRFICLVQRAQYQTSRGSFTSLSVTWGLWQSWWYRLWHSWHSTSWFPIVTVICLRRWRIQQVKCLNTNVKAAFKLNPDWPANNTSQAHFHGKVIRIGLVIVTDVWKEVFARLNCNRGGTILWFLQTGLFRRVHVNQINSDLCGREGGERERTGRGRERHLENGCSHPSNRAVKE